MSEMEVRVEGLQALRALLISKNTKVMAVKQALERQLEDAQQRLEEEAARAQAVVQHAGAEYAAQLATAVAAHVAHVTLAKEASERTRTEHAAQLSAVRHELGQQLEATQQRLAAAEEDLARLHHPHAPGAEAAVADAKEVNGQLSSSLMKHAAQEHKYHQSIVRMKAAAAAAGRRQNADLATIEDLSSHLKRARTLAEARTTSSAQERDGRLQQAPSPVSTAQVALLVVILLALTLTLH